MTRWAIGCNDKFPRSAAWCLSLLSTAAQAQTLGDELILSRLGDPIEVEIAVENWQGFDLSQLTVGNGSAEQYELFGLEYQPILDDLNFSLVGPNLAGEVNVLISSREPVSEPFLELLLVLSWPAGSTARDYVLLFDPPLVAPPVSGDTVQTQTPQQITTLATVPDEPPVVEAQAAITEPATMPLPVPVPPAPAPEQTDVRTRTAIDVDDVAGTAPVVPVPATDALNVERRRYAVRDNDTLWVIARQFQPAGAAENLYQFLISLHDLNREAFINGNISLLRSGADLLIPTARDVSSINPSTAQTLFEQRWADGTRVATGTASAPPPEFAVLNETAEEEPAPEVMEPVRPPASELPVVQQNTGLATAVSTEVIPVAAVPDVALVGTAGVVADARSQTVTPGASGSAVIAPDNPYLQRVVDSAQKIEQLLETRQQRLAQVEEQLLAMRIQMQEAQIAALQLNVELQQAQALREQQRADNLRDVTFLGTLVAGLLLALVWAMQKTATLHRQIREFARYRDEIRVRKQATLEPVNGIITAEQPRLEIVEIREDLPAEAAASAGSADEIEHDLDKVPDIGPSAEPIVDFLVVEQGTATVEDSARDPKSVV